MIDDCPRRLANAGGPFSFVNEHKVTWDGRQCSYCGSLHPDDFMQWVREGYKLDVTDKDYKIYLCNAPTKSPTGKFYFYHLSEDQMKEFVDLYNQNKLNFGEFHFAVFPFFMKTKKES